VAPPATAAGFASYQPFALPDGFKQTILATEIGDFRPVAGPGADLPDMMVLNETGPKAGRYLYRTHEVGSNGAVTVTDLVTGRTSLVDQKQHYESLDGIVWTPWHTLLFAEEKVVASFRDPRVPNAFGGLVYEYDPSTGVSVPRPAVGARSHEGLRFDAQGNLYGISESTPNQNGSGALYKFVPDRRGDLSSGQLYALKVLSASRTGNAVWVPLDRQQSQVNSDAAAIAVGATGWGRPEDIEISTSNGSTKGGNVMYVTSTSEDLVLRIELNGDEAYVSNFVQDGVNVTGLNNPDNLALDNQGNVYVSEDNGPGDIFIARVKSGNERVAQDVALFASLSDCTGEPTGLYFDRNGKTAWVHIQHAGGPLGNDLLVAITKE
jgi:secreted PhoX family phosphatase